MTNGRLKSGREGQGNTGGGGSSSVWLVSFTDVIALMLTFFVLLYSMSDPDQEKWEYKIGITNEATGTYSGPAGRAGGNEGVNINRIDYGAADRLDYIAAVLDEIIGENNANYKFKINELKNYVEIPIEYESVMKDADGMLVPLARALQRLDNAVTIRIPLATGGRDDAFNEAQSFIEALAHAGYRKPVSIMADGGVRGGAEGNATMDVLIAGHDGRRITR